MKVWMNRSIPKLGYIEYFGKPLTISAIEKDLKNSERLDDDFELSGHCFCDALHPVSYVDRTISKRVTYLGGSNIPECNQILGRSQ